jgi:predicted ATPase/DNA-binding SARP family transcriptional activator
MPKLEFYFFGPPRIERDGEKVEISLRKALALLAYMVVTKQPYSRDALATLLWPDTDPSIALGRLRRALYRVNRAVEAEILLATRTMIELNRQVELWLDTDRFQQDVTACLFDSHSVGRPRADCLARLTHAAELYAGDFLAGFTLPDSPAFDEWQFFEGESLRRSFAKVLNELTHVCRAQEKWDQAIAYARRWTTLDRLDELAHRTLMELYASTGQHAAALRQYNECQRILTEELGALPEKETTALYEAIKMRQMPNVVLAPGSPLVIQVPGERPSQRESGAVGSMQRERRLGDRVARPDWPCATWPTESSRTPGPPHNLPASPHRLVGRDRELAELHSMLIGDAHCRLLTIIGPGGMGKSHLALELAHKAIPDFSDGVYLVPLTCLTSAEHLVPMIAEQLGLNFFGDDTSRQQLFSYLNDKRMLLVLDNFEHLLPDAAVIAHLLQIAPGVKVLATSHEALHLTGESRYVLSGLDFPQEGSTTDPLAFDSVQLLIQRARLARSHLQVRSDDLFEAARICRLVQGMPLALALAAGWLGVLPFREIADEISRSLDFLEGPMHDLPVRHHSVRAAFEYTWKRLPLRDQQAFARLSVFRDGFTKQAAKNVADAGPRTLRRLIDKSLISVGRDGRYEIHDVLRQYAAEQLEMSGDPDRIHDLHSDYYLAALSKREADLKEQRQIEAMDEIDRAFANIRTAWQWAVQHNHDDVLIRSIESLYLFAMLSGRYQDGIELLGMAREQLVSCSHDEPTLGCSRLVTRLAGLQLLNSAAYTQIEADLNRSLALARERTDRPETAFCLLQLGCYHCLVTRQPEVASQFFEESLDVYRPLDDRFYTAVVLHWLERVKV